MHKPSFFHTFEFNCSLIVMFFIAFVAVTCAILPMMGLHSLGVAASDELSKYSEPRTHHIIPTDRPSFPNPVHGIPVAMQEGEAP